MSNTFLGTGWKFPLQVTPKGEIAKSSHEQRIEESIYLILSTAKGERVMMADFGCGIHDLVFEPNNSNILGMVAEDVRQTLTTYEPRIDVLGINVETEPEQANLLLIKISYSIRETNTIGNMVYPFYINEGA